MRHQESKVTKSGLEKGLRLLTQQQGMDGADYHGEYTPDYEKYPNIMYYLSF